MDPTYSAEAEEYREKIRAFLAEHLPADWQGVGALPEAEQDRWVKEWRQTLASAGLLAVAWPKEYGGAGLSPIEQVVLNEEFAKANVPTQTGNDGFGIGMIGPTLIVWGTEEQKRHFLPRIIDGTDLWCQGYSEPDAGSDLANVATRAILDGDEWVVNGQKIWTSSGHTANWIFVLARTDPAAPKHAGISFLLVPMDQPGVEVRPIKEMTGEALFNEVFFTDARTPRENVVGEVNNGWTVANTLLGFERGGRSTVLSIGYRSELDAIVELAKKKGADRDPRIRQRLAWAHSQVEIMRYLGMQSLTSALAGNQPGPGASIIKLFWSEYHKKVTELALDILGPEAMAPTGEVGGSSIQAFAGGEMSSAQAVRSFLGARPGTIYAGTSQVQRNIIGERVLGLPKEPRADAGPWKDQPKG
ncbi:acyl-CoA dehydrogenase family protein [Actinomarinicola tropica]|uniref:Acyl-CoA dehydrogenase n=1 Tax=Actinomarinicola tropica TaxID=2789776 RepID=A0A5Q2RG30_9ACTN|nr:acyl-CoA dehydrogenase family protein [Actinomarinicola tropica]QGG95768.1 acyl-CoA dehydrogenase [Actinomarinicola tropica]